MEHFDWLCQFASKSGTMRIGHEDKQLRLPIQALYLWALNLAVTMQPVK